MRNVGENFLFVKIIIIQRNAKLPSRRNRGIFDDEIGFEAGQNDNGEFQPFGGVHTHDSYRVSALRRPAFPDGSALVEIRKKIAKHSVRVLRASDKAVEHGSSHPSVGKSRNKHIVACGISQLRHKSVRLDAFGKKAVFHPQLVEARQLVRQTVLEFRAVFLRAFDKIIGICFFRNDGKLPRVKPSEPTQKRSRKGNIVQRVVQHAQKIEQILYFLAENVVFERSRDGYAAARKHVAENPRPIRQTSHQNHYVAVTNPPAARSELSRDFFYMRGNQTRLRAANVVSNLGSAYVEQSLRLFRSGFFLGNAI